MEKRIAFLKTIGQAASTYIHNFIQLFRPKGIAFSKTIYYNMIIFYINDLILKNGE